MNRSILKKMMTKRIKMETMKTIIMRPISMRNYKRRDNLALIEMARSINMLRNRRVKRNPWKRMKLKSMNKNGNNLKEMIQLI